MATDSLSSVPDVIAALGGPDALSNLTGRGVRAVSMWKVRGKFASETYAVMIEALRERGLDAPRSLWGQLENAVPVS